MENEIQLLKNSIKDYFTKDMLKIALYPFIGSAIVLYMLFFTLADMGLYSLQETQVYVQQHEMVVENGVANESITDESYTGSSILDFLLKYTASWWIVSFFVYTIGFFVIGYLSIFISLIIVGFFTPKILSIVHKRHFSNLEIHSNFSVIDGIVQIVKSALMMLILFVLLFPLYFIPFFNIVAINIPFYYFFHKMLHFDIRSTITSKEQFVNIYYNEKGKMRLRTVFLYTLALIPFVAFFIAVFYIIYLGHVYFAKLSKMRN